MSPMRTTLYQTQNKTLPTEAANCILLYTGCLMALYVCPTGWHTNVYSTLYQTHWRTTPNLGNVLLFKCIDQGYQEGTFWKCLGVVWQINWTRKASMQTLQNVILKTIAYYESAAKQWAIPCYYWSWVQFREFCLVILSPTLCILYKRLKMLLESLRLYTNYNRMVGKKSRN